MTPSFSRSHKKKFTSACVAELSVEEPKVMGIDTETWRARIGLYHGASVARHIKKHKVQAEQVRCAEQFVWQMVNGAPSPCQFGLATLILLICLRCSLDKQPRIQDRCRVSIRVCLCTVMEVFFTVAVDFKNAIAAVYKQCIVRLLLLLCGDVERNPGPTLSEGEYL